MRSSRAGVAGPARTDSALFTILLSLLCFGIMVLFALLPLSASQQWLFGGVVVAAALCVDAASRSYAMTLMMVLISSFATLRYAIWRYETLGKFLLYPSPGRRPLDIFFMSILAMAELYTMVILYLGYFQTLYPLQRKPVAMPEELERWPHVDVLIPTYNEPLELVRYTVLAAMNIDWPADRLHIFLLDDGRRKEFREFAARAGVAYVTRSDNQGAKAGNINHALTQSHAPYVAIFDCDHVPVRSFLQFTMGWFFRDPKMALVQTPHHFYSPDPFERNLKQFREVPNEGKLFYGIVQVCNDFWNASFFCGSCAVLRREALDQAGGIATETVTEDAHTSLRMQMAGWNTAYLNTPQAAGLATERLSGHVKQRVRWARGMIQILRREKPLIAPELTWAQRLCYFNAMMHFLYALPRLIFLTAPLVYLIFGYRVLPGSWDMIMAFALPHILLAQITNSRIQGEHRHSFWNEVYETVLAPYILLPTLLALISPKSGKFDVTDKGGVVEESYLDTHIAQPFFVLLFFNLLGLVMVPVRLLYLDRMHPGTVFINAMWDLLSLVIIGVAIGVAYESQQRRQSIRVAMRTLAWIVLPDGVAYEGSTVDLSAGGSAIHLDQSLPPSGGVEVQVVLPRPSGSNISLPARIVGGGGHVVRVQFQQLSVLQERKLVGVLFSRANAWLNWADNTGHDSLGRSFALIVKLSAKGLGQAARSLLELRRTQRKERRSRGTIPITASSMGLVLAFIGLAISAAAITPQGYAQMGTAKHSVQVSPPASPQPDPLAATVPDVPPVPNNFQSTYSLAQLGGGRSIELRGNGSDRTLNVILPKTQVAKQATLHVRYLASPALIPGLSHINVTLNGTILAALPVVGTPSGSTSASPSPASGAGPNRAAVHPLADTPLAAGASSSAPAFLDQVVVLPGDLLVDRNTLSFQLIGHYTATTCEDPQNSSIWAQIDPETTLDVSGDRMAMANDLTLLPLPFFDRDSPVAPKISIVFLSPPSSTDLDAASVVASWIGVLANYRHANFSVSIGQIPPGNAIVFATRAAAATVGAGPSLVQFGLADVEAPTLAMRTNPGDPFGKLLILAGADSRQLLEAAQALALGSGALAGETSQVTLQLPAPRMADDAPRWLNGSRSARLGRMQSSTLESDGSSPVETYLRTAPDLYYGLRRNLGLHLYYRYNPVPLAPRSHLTMSVNGAYVASIPLPGGDRVSREGYQVLDVPSEDMAPFANTLEMNFVFPVSKSGPCLNGQISDPRGAILPDSYLDLKGIPHWAALPNLQLFSNSGFPFTRFADLAQTQIVLPQQPTPAEIQLLLSLIAQMGGETGYPALRLTVGSPPNLDTAADRDLLIIGSIADQPAFQQLAGFLPAVPRPSGIEVRHPGGFFAPVQHFWWRIQGRPAEQGGQVDISGTVPDAMIEGIESPYRRGRSIVVVMVRGDAEVQPFLKALGEAANSSTVGESVSIFKGKSFQSYRLGNSFYHVGKLPLWDFLAVQLAAFPYLGALVLLFFCFILALVAHRWLRRRAARRLLDRGDFESRGPKSSSPDSRDPDARDRARRDREPRGPDTPRRNSENSKDSDPRGTGKPE